MTSVETTETIAEPSVRAESRERLAWAVLLGAFTLFVVLVITLPLGARWYIHNATRTQQATVQSSSGTTLVLMPTVPDPFAVVEGVRKESVEEGSTIRTDATSQAVVTLFDRSQITLFPNSELTLRRMRQPRFSRSGNPSEVVAEVARGRVRVGVVGGDTRPVLMQVRTPQAAALLDVGSFVFEVSNDVSHVVVRGGTAHVSGQTGQAVLLKEGERSDVRLGQAASTPLRAARNIITNGAFEQPLAVAPVTSGPVVEGWVAYNDQGGDGGSADGQVEVGIWGGRRAIRFYRTNSGNNHGETGIRQNLNNRYVGDYRSLRLRLDVNLISQSLSGGGQQSSEFPLIVRINYRDSYGNENHWTRGFYYENPQGYHIENGQAIARDTWHSYDEADLKALIPDLVFLSSIQIYASGWDYEVFVSEAGLIAE